MKAIAYQLAEQTPDSDTPLVRSRILAAAALRVEAERMAWEIGQGHSIDTEALRKPAAASKPCSRPEPALTAITTRRRAGSAPA